MAALASPEVGVALAKSSGCAPSNSKAYEDPEVAADELIVAIQKTAETAEHWQLMNDNYIHNSRTILRLPTSYGVQGPKFHLSLIHI